MKPLGIPGTWVFVPRIHSADVSPSQAKYVTCVGGGILDVVVDLRAGSPSFARWEAVNLDAETRRAVHLAEGRHRS